MGDFIRVELLNFEPDSWSNEKFADGTLVGTITRLNDLLSSVPAERRGSVQCDIGYESDYGGAGSAYVKIWYERPKTTEEIEAERLEAEHRRAGMARQQEMRERQQLAALKAKYGE